MANPVHLDSAESPTVAPTPTTAVTPRGARSRRRGDLAQFLRSRRARIAPADVGIPAGPRRRTPGLRREEVAQLAGVGVTWYTWLEQGRPIRASTQVLDAIARTLRLDQAEREHLYRLADVPAVSSARAECLPAEIQAILDALVPVPAVVYNGRYDVLAWNATYHALFPGLTKAPVGERNALLHLFMVAPCCLAIGNWEAEVRTLVATFRASFGRHLGEPAWTSFVERLSAASPKFAEMWADHDVAGPGARVKIFVQNLGEVRVNTTATSLGISASPEIRLVVYTPMSDADAGALAELTKTPPEIALCPYHAAIKAASASARSDAPV